MKITGYDTEDGKVSIHYRSNSVTRALFLCQEDDTVQTYETAIPLELDDLCYIKRALTEEIEGRVPVTELGVRLERILEDMRIPVVEDSEISINDLNSEGLFSSVPAMVSVPKARNTTPSEDSKYLKSIGGRTR